MSSPLILFLRHCHSCSNAVTESFPESVNEGSIPKSKLPRGFYIEPFCTPIGLGQAWSAAETTEAALKSNKFDFDNGRLVVACSPLARAMMTAAVLSVSLRARGVKLDGDIVVIPYVSETWSSETEFGKNRPNLIRDNDTTTATTADASSVDGAMRSNPMTGSTGSTTTMIVPKNAKLISSLLGSASSSVSFRLSELLQTGCNYHGILGRCALDINNYQNEAQRFYTNVVPSLGLGATDALIVISHGWMMRHGLLGDGANDYPDNLGGFVVRPNAEDGGKPAVVSTVAPPSANAMLSPDAHADAKRIARLVADGNPMVNCTYCGDYLDNPNAVCDTTGSKVINDDNTTTKRPNTPPTRSRGFSACGPDKSARICGGPEGRVSPRVSVMMITSPPTSSPKRQQQRRRQLSSPRRRGTNEPPLVRVGGGGGGSVAKNAATTSATLRRRRKLATLQPPSPPSSRKLRATTASSASPKTPTPRTPTTPTRTPPRTQPTTTRTPRTPKTPPPPRTPKTPPRNPPPPPSTRTPKTPTTRTPPRPPPPPRSPKPLRTSRAPRPPPPPPRSPRSRMAAGATMMTTVATPNSTAVVFAPSPMKKMKAPPPAPLSPPPHTYFATTTQHRQPSRRSSAVIKTAPLPPLSLPPSPPPPPPTTSGGGGCGCGGGGRSSSVRSIAVMRTTTTQVPSSDALQMRGGGGGSYGLSIVIPTVVSDDNNGRQRPFSSSKPRSGGVSSTSHRRHHSRVFSVV